MNAPAHWLYQWIDEEDLHAQWEVQNALKSGRATARLYEILHDAAKTYRGLELPTRADVGDSIVAGSSIDLSGAIGCTAYKCMRNSIDESFKNVWHYFDTVMVEGLDPMRTAEDLDSAKTRSAINAIKEGLETQINLMLYLRETGADKYTIFYPKPHRFCDVHWAEHAERLGIEDVLDPERQRKIVGRMIKDSNFETHKLGPAAWTAQLTGPNVGLEQVYLVTTSAKPTRKSIASRMLGDHAAAMISDIEMARRMTLPLIQAASVPWIGRSSETLAVPTAESIALELNLPVFAEIGVSDFLKLRKDEQPYFERYRAALREAIDARLTPENAHKPVGEIARSIENDFLRPGLADIERRVRNNRRAVAKQSAISLSIGAVTAAIGSLASVPWVIAGAAIGTSVPLAPLINKYVDERDSSIPMSDLYFLWQAKKHAGRGSR